ncbi:MAG: anaerobic ribonucleoside-triphosphate reductase activating protein [Oscillospiraceae bacterium]|nr:anaerobic ribonucleoside-triphosphate reductase activating protein [Oscillospiraceae bacterium]
MNYAEIKFNDIANGKGVRVSLFVSGCTHRCKGCFNEIAWDFSYGNPFTEETEQMIISELEKPFISGLTLLGGEPMEPQNQKALLPFIKRVKEKFPQKNIWCYTGYTLISPFMLDEKANTEDTKELLSLIDVLVDGRFIEEEYDISLKFRGSRNQRLIDMNASREKDEIILLNI